MSGPQPAAGEFMLTAEGIGATLAYGGCWFTATGAGDFTSPGTEQLATLADARGLGGRALALGTQVHGSSVRLVAGPRDARGGGEFDGQVTTSREVICAVRTADCLPVALFSEDAAGAIHAGWRGLAAGVLEAGVAAMREAGPGQLSAVIGPGARSCCYEVGDEVHSAFAAFGPQARAGRNADLPWVAARKLHELGVEQQFDCGICTICAEDPSWHSHRRSGREAGRSLGMAWRS